MLKVNLTKYPLEIEKIDRLIIYMVYHQILTVEELVSAPEEELSLLGGWTEDIRSSIETIRKNHPLD